MHARDTCAMRTNACVYIRVSLRVVSVRGKRMRETARIAFRSIPLNRRANEIVASLLNNRRKEGAIYRAMHLSPLSLSLSSCSFRTPTCWRRYFASEFARALAEARNRATRAKDHRVTGRNAKLNFHASADERGAAAADSPGCMPSATQVLSKSFCSC